MILVDASERISANKSSIQGIMGLNPSCLAHLNGLEFLIRQRGGLEKLGMSGIAQPYILR